ncbi:hypothetical protein ANN_21794 [Periplaneta americana]|uniref:Reverse transcriptase domain-containing protein n=1 Tax=Periplaneta americana TaxID=6978 RepID=A0ABQ8S6P8_PERAM|nr:hypothetical protein ANN_21794 [Periplaneta americana]
MKSKFFFFTGGEGKWTVAMKIPTRICLNNCGKPWENYSQVLVATFADDTAILASHEDPSTASENLQNELKETEDWLITWRIQASENKSVHFTSGTRTENCPPVTLYNKELPEADGVKYLVMHLDRRLTWRKHIETKLILKPIWTYGIQLWGTASNSNIEILQRYQSKTLRSIVTAPWYVRNDVIHHDLNISTVKEEISKFSKKYLHRLNQHPNQWRFLGGGKGGTFSSHFLLLKGGGGGGSGGDLKKWFSFSTAGFWLMI